MNTETILAEISSETGEIKINGRNLQRVNSLDIHMDNQDRTRITIDVDNEEEKILLLIEGEVKWFRGIDREKIWSKN